MSGADAWMVRAGNDNELITVFQTRDIVAIGWSELDDVSQATSREAIKTAYRDVFPDHNKQRVATNGGQVYQFAHEIQIGDQVATYDKTEREYLVGEVNGEYEFDPEDAPDEYSHIRAVDWNGAVPRDDLPTDVKNTLGSTLTVFSITDQWDTIRSVMEGDTEGGETGETGPPYIEEVESQADELISDIIANMDPYGFEELVAAVLRAMGYEARKTRDSHDYGVDVIAHPDALGFEDPYLKVQVKRQKGTVGGPDIRQFTGTLGQGEKGLYVATGGYTTDARTEARSAAQ